MFRTLFVFNLKSKRSRLLSSIGIEWGLLKLDICPLDNQMVLTFKKLWG